MSTVTLMLRFELQSRSRRLWTMWAALGLSVLSVSLMYASAGIAREAGIGPSTGAFVNVQLLIVPLLGLLMGALTVARDRERGTLSYLRAQPVALDQIFWTKWIALMLSLSVVVGSSFALTLIALAALGGVSDPSGIVQMGLTTWLLAVVMGSCGFAFSARADKIPSALGMAVAAWLLFVLFADLGVMVSALVTHMGTALLTTVTIANPVEAYKIAAVSAMNGSVDVLGPGGRLATDLFGAWIMPAMVAIMIFWVAGATALARVFLERSCRA